MKKFTLVILSFCLLILNCLTFNGCKKKGYPKFTAENPVFTSAELAQNCEIYRSFEVGSISGDCDPYEEFIKFYKTDFKSVSDKNFYVLNFGEPSGEIAVDRKRICTIYGNINNNVLENSFLYQHLQIHDSALGGYYDRKPSYEDGTTNWSVILSIICVPVEQKTAGGFILEFGKKEDDNSIFDGYINIYCESVCIATCRYSEGVDIPLSWYENYFNNNLFYGGYL